jgi:hypothetical protein
MTFDAMAPMGLDYLPCRYGTSKLLFRGPRRDLSKPYVAFLGGTETYGKFIAEPFVDLIEQRLGMSCANFGCMNSGVDVFLNDPFLSAAAAKSRVTVLQIPGAQNMSNRLYTVHPRRNDRFVSASRILQSSFPDVDFADYHFTKHMLTELRAQCPDRYSILEQELGAAWIARMKTLLELITGRVVLVWISSRSPDETDRGTTDPMHVTREMIETIRPFATDYVEVKLSAEALDNPLDGMVYSPVEAPAAREMLGPKAHAEIADALHPVLAAVL